MLLSLNRVHLYLIRPFTLLIERTMGPLHIRIISCPEKSLHINQEHGKFLQREIGLQYKN